MPRAKWTEGAERRRQIVEAALPIFASRSYAEATTAEVARAARISQATVFKHFATKRDLFVAVVERTTELVLEHWQKVAEAAPSPLEGLRAIAEAYSTMAHAQEVTFRVRFRAAAESADPVIAQAARTSYLIIVEFLAEQIARAQQAGQADPAVNAKSAAWRFLAVGQGFNLNNLVGFGWDDALIRELIDSMLRDLTGRR